MVMAEDGIVYTRNDYEDPPAIRPGKVFLGTGLSHWRGIIAEEYLPQLRPWSKAARVYREMIDDSTVGALLEAVRTPLLSAEFNVEAVSSGSEDKRAAKYLKESLFKMPDMEWREHVEEMLDFMAYGFALSEIVFWRKKGEVRLATLMPVGQETIHDWGNKFDRYGNPISVRQQIPSTGKIKEAPLHKLVHFTFRSRKRNPFGMSLLRSLYRPWFFKKNIEVLEAIGVERDVGNMPVAEVGETTLTESQYNDLKAALEAFRVDKAAYLITPPMTKITAYAGGNKVYNTREIIRDWQNIIRQRFFATFISLGTEQVGTQALAREQTTFFASILKGVQNRMLSIWTRQLMPHIFRFSKYSIDDMPLLQWSEPGKENIQMMAQAMATLTNSGIVHTDDDLENRGRVLLGVRPLTDEEFKERAEIREAEKLQQQQQQMLPQGNDSNNPNADPGQPQGAPGNMPPNPKQQGVGGSVENMKPKAKGGAQAQPVGKGIHKQQTAKGIVGGPPKQK